MLFYLFYFLKIIFTFFKFRLQLQNFDLFQHSRQLQQQTTYSVIRLQNVTFQGTRLQLSALFVVQYYFHMKKVAKGQQTLRLSSH